MTAVKNIPANITLANCLLDTNILRAIIAGATKAVAIGPPTLRENMIPDSGAKMADIIIPKEPNSTLMTPTMNSFLINCFITILL